MTDKLLTAMKKQVNAEFYSSYLYLSMSTWCTAEGWKGFANWLYVQSKEELSHALTLHKFLLDIGEFSSLEKIEAPQDTWENPTKLFNDVYEHEKKVSFYINEIANIALEDKNHACYQLIQVFVKEQIEEETNAADICIRLKRTGSNPSILEMLDKELGNRTK